jgi:uncharacterized membrane protein (DUF485 family)
MKKLLMIFLTLATVCGVSVLAHAQSPTPQAAASPAPTNASDPSSLSSALVTDVESGKWVMAFAVLILLIVYYVRTSLFPTQLASGAYPWLSIGLGVIFAVCASVLGGMPVAGAVKIALLSGPAASTLWSSILKLVISKA